MCQPLVAANDGVVSDSDSSKQGGIGIDGNIILQDRVARLVNHIAVFVRLEVLGSQSNSLIEGYVVADNAGLTYYDTCTVVPGVYLCR